MKHLALIKVVALLLVLANASLEVKPSSSSLVEKQTGKFTGIIVDPSGNNISGATVTIKGKSSHLKMKLKSNESGEFTVDLPAGVYWINVKKSGFAPNTLTDVRIEPNTEMSYKFQLEVKWRSGTPPPNNSFNASGNRLIVIRQLGCLFHCVPPR